jgi:rRNA-processing protein FCF1
MIRTAVLDAGPLFSALVSNFNVRDIDRGLRMMHPSSLNEPLRSETAQRDLLRVIGAIPEKLTTSHVIGELQGLSSRLKLSGDDLSNFWLASIDLLRQWNVNEKLIRLLDLALDTKLGIPLPRIGPPDTGLIKLALQHSCVLITEDERTLYREALIAEVECLLLRQLIPNWF